jgi:polysaccharide export outer membrane protein
MKKLLLLVLPAFLAIAACTGSSSLGAGLPSGAAAYGVIPLANPNRATEDYRIGALDALDITVLQEPELSTKLTQVDAFGNVNLPLIGDVKASGKTAGQLAKEVAAKYSEKYLKNPQVSVVVSKPVAQKVVVQGEVIQPGIYPIDGPTTLLGALSLAKGETQVAALNDVAVFRTVNGKRMGAVFDIMSIRRGQTDDPEIRSNDLIIVGLSGSKSMWRDVLTAMPIFRVLQPF